MTDYGPIEVHIQRANIRHAAETGEHIADGILYLWNGLMRILRVVGETAERMTRTPDSYSTSLRQP